MRKGFTLIYRAAAREKVGTRAGFTLIELVVAVALLLLALTVALFATVGTKGLLQRTESRAVVAESSRTIIEAMRQLTATASAAQVQLLTDPAVSPILPETPRIGFQVKFFSDAQHQNVCQVIGRASITPSGSEESFTLSASGSAMAVWIYRLNPGGACELNLTYRLYQARLSDAETTVKTFLVSLEDFPQQVANPPLVPPVPSVTIKQLRYQLRVELTKALSGGAPEARQPSVETVSGFDLSTGIDIVTPVPPSPSPTPSPTPSGTTGPSLD